MKRLESIIARIRKPDFGVAEAAQAHLDNLTKPQGSLGRLEEFAKRLCIIRGSAEKLTQPKAASSVFAGDHGVAAGGVSAFPQDLTKLMVYNFLSGGAAINVLCRQAGADVWVVDVGVASDIEDAEGLIIKKIAYGTADLSKGPAMTADQTLAAIEAGSQVAADLATKGYDLLIPGEMGIGNTTPCSAITAVMCGAAPEQVVGRGTGIDDDGLARKCDAIKAALEINRPDAAKPFEVLQKVGGLEIAAMCGYILEGAARGVVVLLDGFICTTAALIAAAMCPPAMDYCFSAHSSVEIGHRVQVEKLNLRPMLELDMRLGEGTGAAVALGLIRSAVAMYSEMSTFADIGAA